MERKESRNAGFALQGMLLLVFFVALSIFSVWFFAQRGWWLPRWHRSTAPVSTLSSR